MNTPYIISQLEKNIYVFRELLINVPPAMINWRSQPDKWNFLEIVCHLYDEEREDFRARIKHVLERPSDPLPAIDPTGWVLSRNYSSKDFQDTLKNFLDERKKSVEWLSSLVNPPLENAYKHPKFGPLSGKLFLANWLAHDYLHIRQIIKVKYDYLSMISIEKLDYAGSW